MAPESRWIMDAMGMSRINSAPMRNTASPANNNNANNTGANSVADNTRNNNTNTAQGTVNTNRTASAANSVNTAGVSSVNNTQQNTDRTNQVRDNNEDNRRQLENVVSVSQDGDTVQVAGDQARMQNRGQDGSVTARANSAGNEQRTSSDRARQERLDRAQAAARQRAEQARVRREEQAQRARENERTRREQAMASSADSPENRRVRANQANAQVQAQNTNRALDDAAAQNRQDNTRAQQVTNFAGVSNTRLEEMYRKGEITRQQYDTQIARREEQKQSMVQNNTATSQEMARLNGTLTKAQMDSNSIRTAFSDNANANAPADAQSRMAAMQRVQDGQIQQRTQQQTAANNEGRRQWDYQLQA